ncbi:hypothetical protein [Jiella pacifica]|uniref:Uncharacterized protein n=1 Tax=Jiella pacifica TaxID=2696469 RepID=A0A6N9T0Y9_9HYPH|nr:hypothetical protein [Jiella pacifica]NDW03589.1 hypothetical protein [Jiella pacifica]
MPDSYIQAYNPSHDKYFYDSYLPRLAKNYESFSTFFYTIYSIFMVFSVLSIIISLIAMAQSGIFGFLNITFVAINFFIIVWISNLLRDFFKIQYEKTVHENKTMVSFRESTMEKSNEILFKAQSRADSIVNTLTIGGSVSGIVQIGSGHSANQVRTQSDENDIRNSLALLIAYCEQSNNPTASQAAIEFREEASKDSPSQNVLLTLWTRMVAALPIVAQIVGITGGIMKLLTT